MKTHARRRSPVLLPVGPDPGGNYSASGVNREVSETTNPKEGNRNRPVRTEDCGRQTTSRVRRRPLADGPVSGGNDGPRGEGFGEWTVPH